MQTLMINLSKDSWTDITTGLSLLPGIVYRFYNNGPDSIKLTEQTATPNDNTGFVVILPNKEFNLKSSGGLKFWGKSRHSASSLAVLEDITGAINQDSLDRPMSSTGLPGATETNIKGVGTLIAPLDYYVEALAGERLSVSRIIVHIAAAGGVKALEYGDIASLTNGIQVFHRKNGVMYNIIGDWPIQVNEDWPAWSFDGVPILYPSGTSPTFSARWSFDKYNHPDGIMLEEGDRIGVRIRDDLSTLSHQTIIAQGAHFGVRNPAWDFIIT